MKLKTPKQNSTNFSVKHNDCKQDALRSYIHPIFLSCIPHKHGNSYNIQVKKQIKNNLSPISFKISLITIKSIVNCIKLNNICIGSSSNLERLIEAHNNGQIYPYIKALLLLALGFFCLILLPITENTNITMTYKVFGF